MKETYAELLEEVEDLKGKIARGEHVIINSERLIIVGRKIARLRYGRR
ncbi:hypothetical protein [Cuniculiplasma divulgatum]|uniref:Uncharacterized protein n=1 Tax=Cuniculiplasma divulgatum TaxID=1673428 RepID=A0A1R4A6Z9_9ARCH|nr:hypothetical protein [Cuniculiplasma divulgatum]MCI2413497.1 hypothetical protein [Cuniculiplasma sp.]SJK84748.1 hypothetical protein CPM_0906 [Cuniculiplasma divulgatum]